MIVHHEGYRWAEPGTRAEAECRICGARCEIRRSVFGPTNWASAIAGRKRLHDHIVCPNVGQGWHNQATELHREAATTLSPTVAAILRSDLETLVRQHRSSS